MIASLINTVLITLKKTLNFLFLGYQGYLFIYLSIYFIYFSEEDPYSLILSFIGNISKYIY